MESAFGILKCPIPLVVGHVDICTVVIVRGRHSSRTSRTSAKDMVTRARRIRMSTYMCCIHIRTFGTAVGMQFDCFSCESGRFSSCALDA